VLSLASLSESKRALVLSGGAAKGAFQVGALKTLCQKDKNLQYDMVVGTSIGALNAVALSQSSKSEFCSKGVPVIEAFWKDIKSTKSIFESWSRLSFGECLNPINFLSIANGWYKKGGMCSTKPGKDSYKKLIKSNIVKSSDVKVFVSASPLDDTVEAAWFTNDSPNIDNCAFASSALSPLFAPEKMEGKHYIDGGFFTNVPIRKAIKEGATSVDVFLLLPLGNEASTEDVKKAIKDKKFGPYAAQHFFDVVSRALTLNSEIRIACEENPTMKIRAIIPRENIGETLGFSEKEISKMILDGEKHATQYGLEDLCAAVSKLNNEIGEEFQQIVKFRTEKSNESNNNSNNNNNQSRTLIIVGSSFGGALIGGVFVFAFLVKRRKVDPNAFFEIPAQQKEVENQ